MKSDHLLYCHQALPSVSRTFALGIDILQEPLRDAVCVAYLICRILDTVEDTTSLPADVRINLLEQAGREFPEQKRWADCCAAIGLTFPAGRFPGPDHDLCRQCARVLEAFHAFPEPVKRAIIPSVREMADGMAATVLREVEDGNLQLETIEDLKQYCYYVAGTVGFMLTGLFSLERPSITGEINAALRRHAVNFGLGLQLTNIIKGITDDISRGVCYLPRQLLDKAGVTLQGLLDNPADFRGAALVSGLIIVALEWLDSAFEYTIAIPPREADIRLFCSLPLIFAIRTLGLAGRMERVFGEQPLKISREEVTAISLHLKKISTDDTALREFYSEEKAKMNTVEPQNVEYRISKDL